jgi:beta propeller repeat protein
MRSPRSARISRILPRTLVLLALATSCDRNPTTAPDKHDSVGAPRAAITGFETAVVSRLTFKFEQGRPAIDGNRVVFQDRRSGNYDIYMVDVSTNVETQLTTNTGNQTYPSISGTRVVYLDDRNGNTEIYMTDVTTGVETRITTTTSIKQAPSISGNRIVWNDFRSPTNRAYMHDLVTGVQGPIGDAYSMLPVIGGDWVAFVRNFNNTGNDVVALNVVTNETINVAMMPANQMPYGISGTKLAYDGAQDGNWNVYVFDLATRTTTQVTSLPSTQQVGRISGNTVVYQSNEVTSGRFDLFMQDLVTGERVRLTTESTQLSGLPAISGERIVWPDTRNAAALDHLDIYMFGPPLPVRNTAPTAVVSGPGSGDEGTTLAFSAAASSDAEGSALTYTWNFGDGSPEEFGPAETTKEVAHAFADNGSFVVTLKVKDADGLMGSATFPVTINNVAPAGTFLTPPSVQSLEVFQLQMLGVQDQGPADASAGTLVRFDCGSGVYGPATSTPNTSCTAPAAGPLHVRAELSDKDGGVREYSADIPLVVRRPIAAIGGSTTGLEGDMLSFSGANSYHSGGLAMTYSWNFGDGTPIASGSAESHVEIGHVFADNGSYTVTLTVSDGLGQASSASLTVAVTNVAPFGVFRAPQSVQAETAFQLQVLGVQDPSPADAYAGTLVRFDCGSGIYGPASSTPNTICTAPATGPLRVRAELRDKDAGVTEYAEEISVIVLKPVAVLSGTSTALEGSAATFSGVDSYHTGGATMMYRWNFGDGSPEEYGPLSTHGSRSHIYADNGAHVVTLTVIDAAGKSGSATMTVDVANVAPVVSLPAAASILSAAPFTLEGAFTDPGNDSWVWTIDWNDGLQSGNSSTPGTISAQHTFASAGTRSVRLTVTDDDGAQGTAVIVITVVDPVITAIIDVRPERINLNARSAGTVPVVLFSRGLRAADVDVSSITLGDDSGSDTPVARKVNGALHASLEDVDGDGQADLVLHFDRTALITSGDLTASTTTLVLTGRLKNGRTFRGEDAVRSN